MASSWRVGVLIVLAQEFGLGCLYRPQRHALLFVNYGLLERVEGVVAWQGGLPDHDKSAFFRFDNDCVKLAPVMLYSAGDPRAEPEADAGQTEAQETLWSEVAEIHFFAALEETVELLVGRAAPEVGVVKVLRDER